MIDNNKLRYRSPITGKIKTSMILEYSLAGMILEADEQNRGKLITAILEHELYGGDAVPEITGKDLGIYYAVTSDLDMKGGEWIQSCYKNQGNSKKKNNPLDPLDPPDLEGMNE